MLDYSSVLRAFTFAVVYGVMENRFFFENHEDPVLLNHFKRYHLLMLLLFAIACFTTDILLLTMNLIMMPLVQDLTWQLIEHRTLKREDWSNLGGYPLVHGIYLWYILDGFAVLGLGLLKALIAYL